MPGAAVLPAPAASVVRSAPHEYTVPFASDVDEPHLPGAAAAAASVGALPARKMVAAPAPAAPPSGPSVTFAATAEEALEAGASDKWEMEQPMLDENGEPYAPQLGELMGNTVVQTILAQRDEAAQEAAAREAAAMVLNGGEAHSSPYECAVLDDDAATLSEWRRRDAHEFVVVTCLGLSFWLEAAKAVYILCTEIGSFNEDTVTIFLKHLLSAFLAVQLVYSLFVAARWLPPAAKCTCCVAVPSALFRLVALALVCAYTALHLKHFLGGFAALAVAPQPDEQEAAQGLTPYCLLIFYALTSLLNLCACFVIWRRLHVQALEDDRPWLSVRAHLNIRASRKNLV